MRASKSNFLENLNFLDESDLAEILVELIVYHSFSNLSIEAKTVLKGLASDRITRDKIITFFSENLKNVKTSKEDTLITLRTIMLVLNISLSRIDKLFLRIMTYWKIR